MLRALFCGIAVVMMGCVLAACGSSGGSASSSKAGKPVSAQIPASGCGAVKLELPEDPDGVVASLANGVERHLFTPELTPSGIRGYFLFQLRARRRLRDKFNYLRFVATPTEEDLVRMKLPAALTFVYYLMRPVRLVVTGGPSHFH